GDVQVDRDRFACRAPRDSSRTSLTEWAGSVETSSTRFPSAAVAIAAAAAHVVLPTPPLPAKNRKRAGDVLSPPGVPGPVPLVLLPPHARLDAGDRELARLRALRGAALANVPDRVQELPLDLGELGLGDLAELELHLRGEKLLAIHGVVV